MNLPKLPRKNKRREAKMDDRVAKWFEKAWGRSAIIEVKMQGGKLLKHQEKLLKKVGKTGKFTYKFPDGGTRTPLDYIVLRDVDAVLAVCDDDGNCHCTINNGQITEDIKV